nr:MAG TPA: hypothetical protein [Caudoviricetes sp.]
MIILHLKIDKDLNRLWKEDCERERKEIEEYRKRRGVH